MGSLRFWLRVATAIVIALVGLGLGLEEAGVWEPTRRLATTMIAASVAIAFITTTEAAIAQYRHGRAEEIREQARAVLAPLLLELEEATGISTRYLGVSAYRLRPKILPFRKRRLERLVRMQLIVRVASGIAWREGVGVIGQCVERREDIIENLATLDEQLADVTPAEWNELPADLTYGLTYDEYTRVRGKYEVILATPMIRETPLGSRVIGCIAIDAPQAAFDALTRDETRGIVGAAAVPLAALLTQAGLRWR
ncbi:MAG TPA: hypothetical protein VFR23_09540 [Jiangellaceae bacterium]|nr:hypothetical protein [Jiangellaceae bacterium]